MPKILHYLNYKGHFYMCIQRKANASRFWKFRRVVKCYNWTSNNAVASLLYADIFEVYLVSRFYTNVINLHF